MTKPELTLILTPPFVLANPESTDDVHGHEYK